MVASESICLQERAFEGFPYSVWVLCHWLEELRDKIEVMETLFASGL